MKTLYVIHGWTYTVEPWTKTIEILKNHGIEIKMLNVPGLTSPSGKVWKISDYVKWADENIPDGAVALGHSNGGRILLNLLSKKPEKLKHVILLDSAGVYEESKKRDIARKVSKLMAPLKRIKPLRKVYHKVLGASDYDRAPENMKRTLVNMLESDKKLDMTSVSTPATILWGKMDNVTPPRQAATMHRRLKNSEIKYFDNWTHAPYICDPEGLAKAIYVTMEKYA
ncbi:alpha/beta fold hydrolase [Candidatus Saccharibacteria bacterium]|nr:alpha/beta fold hydrolase [Candidatus Saccharibacteria bacterium]